MALDATVAGASADSYLTVAEADVFATATVEDSETVLWMASSTTIPMREAALRDATVIVDALLPDQGRWAALQALRFPRAFVDYSLVAGVRTPLVRPGIKRATAAQARYLLANAKVLSRARARMARGLASYSEPANSGTERPDVRLEIISPLTRAILDAYIGTDSGRSLGSVSAGVSLAGWVW